MKSLLSLISEVFLNAIRRAYPQVADGFAIKVSETRSTKFGDYQCNNAMELFKRLQSLPDSELNPKPINVAEVAKKIIESLPANDLVSKTDIAGPGFINVTLSRPYVSGLLTTIVRHGQITPPPLNPPTATPRRVVVDFSSPNIAKEMHVGHLRSTILGETFCRILQFAGHEVHRVNHLGDWGTQFGMLICYLKDEFPDYQAQPPNIQDLNAFYRLAKQRFDEDPDFKRRSQEEVVRLQAHEPENIRAWKMFCDISRAEFQRIYDRLGVTIEERGESFYNPMLASTVRDMEAAGVIQDSDGAKVCFVPQFPQFPLMVQKSDGGFSYDTTDMAAIRYRLHETKADWIIYVVDAGQGPHFDLIFAAAEMVGWLDRSKQRVDHTGFGLVCGTDGKKFKTRSGETVKLVDLLDTAVAQATEDLKSRESGQGKTPEELAVAGTAIGLSAVKYADLKSNRITNYVFSYERMLDMKGNTAVYLMYAYARICQIVKKADVDVDTLRNSTEILLTEPSEFHLAAHMLRFPDVITGILERLYPHDLCEFLYELSVKFNDFYRDCKVVGHENQNSRLLLCEATSIVMRQCFHLLGITPLTRL